MLLLGIESASLVASVALVRDEALIAEYTLNFKKTHSQTLLPMIDEIMEMTGIPLEEIDGIAVSKGPGSFTGLRIGSATAKGLGLALGKPILPIPTVDAMAYQCYGSGDLICPIMDARRGQVYTGIYKFANFENQKVPFPMSYQVDAQTQMCVLLEQCAISLEELLERLAVYRRPVVFLGDACPVYEEKILEASAFPVRFAPAFSNRQRGAAVAALGLLYLREGVVQTAAEHVPDYLRKSQAERELEAGTIHAHS